MLDAHNFYFCVLALLVVEDMQIGFVDIRVLVEFLKKDGQGSVQNLLIPQCFCTASADLINYFLFFQC